MPCPGRQPVHRGLRQHRECLAHQLQLWDRRADARAALRDRARGAPRPPRPAGGGRRRPGRRAAAGARASGAAAWRRVTMVREKHRPRRREVGDVGDTSSRTQIEHLVEVAVVEAAVPADAQGGDTSSRPPWPGRTCPPASTCRVEVVGLIEPLEEAGDEHVVQRDEAVEGDLVLTLERGPPGGLEARLVAGQKAPAGLCMSVSRRRGRPCRSRRVEALQRADGPGRCPRPAARRCCAPGAQRRHDLDAPAPSHSGRSASLGSRSTVRLQRSITWTPQSTWACTSRWKWG